MFSPYVILAVLALPLASVYAIPNHHIRHGLHHNRKIQARAHSCEPSEPSSNTSSVHSSAAVPQPSSASPPSDGSTSSSAILSELFPVSSTKSWTTAPQANDALSLSDATLRPTKDIKALSHNYVNAPDGKYSMQAHYPKGSYTFSNTPQGGFSFYAPGPADIDLTTAKEATFGYQVFFEEGFEFNMGGKLPGLYGGNSASEAVSCSGGRRDDGCFSARIMWRKNGMGELYTYLPPGKPGNTNVCDVPPFSTCNDVYGASVGRGSFTFASGQWTTVSQRVRLNDVGQANGELELFANGKSVVNVGGLTLRDSADGRIYGIQAQTFFGGSTSAWASPKDQNTYFSDLSVAITETL
ncbi:hypothetical protein B0H21DRAFT_32694 [Amylocystis lapponica]|nr:hypothetical protein B0H21DRAFT_32694 [Amylocystis lapponica]